MKLLIDMGNSRLKWALHETNELSLGEPMTYGLDFKEQIFSRWQFLKQPECVAIANVNAQQSLEQLEEAILQLWDGIKVFKAKSLAEGYGVKNAYQAPEKLGVDRWLALVAARNYYPFSVCIADCGTAITVDFLNQEGRHLGGLIAPGLAMMKKSLAQGTSELNWVNREYIAGLADNTEAAIYTGTLFSMAGLIEHITSKQPDFQLVLTGGDAEIVAKELNKETIVQSDLVLSGLALVSSHSAAEH